MRAADTNVVVRLLARDHPGQHARATGFFRAGTVWIPITVILETEWVLRSAYRSEPQQIARLLRSLLSVPGIEVESAAAVSEALGWFEQGMDFADALHLAAARRCDGLATFDRDFIKTAARLGIANVTEP